MIYMQIISTIIVILFIWTLFAIYAHEKLIKWETQDLIKNRQEFRDELKKIAGKWSSSIFLLEAVVANTKRNVDELRAMTKDIHWLMFLDIERNESNWFVNYTGQCKKCWHEYKALSKTWMKEEQEAYKSIVASILNCEKCRE